MKKSILSLSLLLCLLLAACGPAPAATPELEGAETLHILTTTYPVYLFTTAVTQGVEGVVVSQLVNQQTACLHDYTLTVNDMKAIEKADIIVMNGAGLEDFMADALAQSAAAVIDCSQVEDRDLLLFPAKGHADHDQGGHEEAGEHYDPHIWMDPNWAMRMVENIESGLVQIDPQNETLYRDNADMTNIQLERLDMTIAARLIDFTDTVEVDGVPQIVTYPELSCRWLITFHDGFSYFAHNCELDLLKAIEEEEGAETSAAEIKEIVGLIEEYHIPAIFTERNGSDATAQAISRETGCAVYQLDMIMSGDGTGIQPYLDAMTANIQTIVEAFQ